MKNYYCLVAGLPDLSPDDAKAVYTVARFKEECLPQLTADDRRCVELFFRKYDNRNLLNLMAEPETTEWDERGLLTRDELSDALLAVKQGTDRSANIPAYMWEFLDGCAERNETPGAAERLDEDVLTGGYYAYACSCRNAFVAEWFTFNLNLNNILVALTARRYGFSAASVVVGANAVAEALLASKARDFGLASELDYYDEVARVSETEDPVEKERRLDLLKWNWLEENVFFHYFSVERLFTFLLRLDIIERWSVMDKEKGGALFRQLIARLKEEVEVPAEFKSK